MGGILIVIVMVRGRSGDGSIEKRSSFDGNGLDSSSLDCAINLQFGASTQWERFSNHTFLPLNWMAI